MIEFYFLFLYFVYGETFFAWRRANRDAPLLFGNLASYGALDSPN
ncbi:hypothetical protein LEP1GSC188_3586 [Leptospira weilii serovar Topaz str. LT2116]|uniref:Uncharacterized protein n=1 Tax=Leptospira weilii serovar Topaz str. LT2116 TaxID=1088540 RepID=M3EJ45_9LEPT|nr:hypothetical protein LEP1GSC188_3586 [Leptospira weilii serovar Topaz str. LT2116]